MPTPHPLFKPRRNLYLAAFLPALLATGCHTSVSPGYQRALAAEASPPAADNAKRDQQHIYIQLIKEMQDQGAWYASLAHIDAYRLEYGSSDELELMRAEALRATHQDGAALPVYRKLTQGSSAGAAWHGIGMIESTSNHPASALASLAKACELAPLNADYLADLGFERLRAGAIVEARTPLTQAAELAPTNHRVIANLAIYQLLSGHADEARRLMQGGGLSQQARDAVYRLADQMRPATPAVATVVTAGPAPAARPLPGATQDGSHASRSPDGSSPSNTPDLVPASMLDRFEAPPNSR
ncbi:Flp pilus assembly protein TadD [Frateuria aurantia]